ncbi:hypothetical protein HPB48_020169 [Haemaphysalis longicornis]|uniref:Uncharacterized protein n=1 Tax=Haemaphysalis longicornis TaxID=44386 RepID=A0A9J6FHD3_HAELO|nr:hypothetical protein HPB48_020169 [Haemaphysalis longicornis]
MTFRWVVAVQQNLVKPRSCDVNENVISESCRTEYGISEEQLKNAVPLEQVIDQFSQWARARLEAEAGGQFYFVTDGQLPLRQALHPEAVRHGVMLPDAFYHFFDLRKEFQAFYGKAVDSVQDMLTCILACSGPASRGADRPISVLLATAAYACAAAVAHLWNKVGSAAQKARGASSGVFLRVVFPVRPWGRLSDVAEARLSRHGLLPLNLAALAQPLAVAGNGPAAKRRPEYGTNSCSPVLRRFRLTGPRVCTPGDFFRRGATHPRRPPSATPRARSPPRAFLRRASTLPPLSLRTVAVPALWSVALLVITAASLLFFALLGLFACLATLFAFVRPASLGAHSRCVAVTQEVPELFARLLFPFFELARSSCAGPPFLPSRPFAFRQSSRALSHWSTCPWRSASLPLLVALDPQQPSRARSSVFLLVRGCSISGSAVRRGEKVPRRLTRADCPLGGGERGRCALDTDPESRSQNKRR